MAADAQVADGHDERDRDRDSRFLGPRSRGGHHFPRAGERETLGFDDIHGSVPG
jgi:hypothetical protein